MLSPALSIIHELVGERGLATKKFDRVTVWPALFGSGSVIGLTRSRVSGLAIKAFMRATDFAAARPVFVGDDLTDEHGFAAAAALGGAGVLVGAARETAATYRLASVAAVAAWLEGAA